MKVQDNFATFIYLKRIRFLLFFFAINIFVSAISFINNDKNNTVTFVEGNIFHQTIDYDSIENFLLNTNRELSYLIYKEDANFHNIFLSSLRLSNINLSNEVNRVISQNLEDIYFETVQNINEERIKELFLKTIITMKVRKNDKEDNYYNYIENDKFYYEEELIIEFKIFLSKKYKKDVKNNIYKIIKNVNKIIVNDTKENLEKALNLKLQDLEKQYNYIMSHSTILPETKKNIKNSIKKEYSKINDIIDKSLKEDANIIKINEKSFKNDVGINASIYEKVFLIFILSFLVTILISFFEYLLTRRKNI